MSDESPQWQPRHAIRLIFEYEGEQVRLVAQQSVEIVVTDTNLVSADAPGYYVDARDSAERTLARVAARGAFGRSREVFSDRHDEPITRIDVQQPRGAFSVTLPSPEQADHVTVVRVVEGPGGRAQSQAVDVASFPLGKGAR